jgi:ATP/maltotriose-dependent transcriptional regulator MalT
MGKYDQLTAREFQVLSLLAAGNKDLNIASALAIELETVKSHNKNIFRKLNVRNRAEAVLHWLNHQSMITKTT